MDNVMHNTLCIIYCLDEEMQYQHARPVTLKRADIKKQLQNTVSAHLPDIDIY